jgi:hypothetical protein
MMSSMSEADTRAAFIAAALVLLVMPMLFVVGLAGLMLIMRATGMEQAASVMLAVSVAWGVLVIIGVLLVAMRVIRRSARF